MEIDEMDFEDEPFEPDYHHQNQLVRYELMEYFMEEGPYSGPDSPLRKAIKAGNLDLVKKLVVSDPDEINSPNGKGWTMLHEAAADDNLNDILRFLMVFGADIDYYTDRNGISPLCVASKYECLTNARELIEAGCDMETDFVFYDNFTRYTYGNFTALLIATCRKNSEMVRLLVDSNANVNAKDNMGRTPIFFAIDNNDLESVRNLVWAGADLTVKDSIGYTPMHLVCMVGYLEIFNFLKLSLSDRSIINDQCESGSTPLMLACRFRHYTVAKELIGLGANTSLVDDSGLLSLHMAVGGGYKLFKLLFHYTPKETIEKYASFKYGLGRSLPCLIIEYHGFKSLKLLYNCGLSDEVLKCPDDLDGKLVSPIGYLLLQNWYGKKEKRKYLKFLLSYDFLVDPVYEKEEKLLRDNYEKEKLISHIYGMTTNPPKWMNAAEALVHHHRRSHPNRFNGRFLSMILTKISPFELLPRDRSKQLYLFNEAAQGGFKAALDLLKYACVEPDEVMDMFLKKMFVLNYKWSGHENEVTKFLVDKCITNFTSTFTKLEDINDLANPLFDRFREKEKLFSIYETIKSNSVFPSLTKMCRFVARKQIHKEAKTSPERFDYYLKKIPLPPSTSKFLSYE
ncbi:uncharacterized protein [Halyomorpha halys]|uniref:uncharacterized protein n=1 Tax=Halyomorpha halys TaxID=286706 RepID=UPI0006D4EBCC|nr:uncharacterized protein LOC106682831 [Halyomorpha halys]